jgi:dolichol-phosphate mannosyltransferase
MKNRKTISIIVPVYYNAGSLPALFEAFSELKKNLKAQDLDVQFIFVDDGSGDASLIRLLEFRKKRSDVTVVQLTRNFGAVAATKAGLPYVKGDAFTFCAADLQDPPELIPVMTEHWLKGSKFVICQRISRGDPWFSRLWASAYYFILRRLVIADFPKGGFGMALMDRAMLAPIRDSAKSVYTPLLAFWLGFKPAVIPYHRPARRHGHSMWTFRKKFHVFLDVMLGFSVAPIRIMSGLGAIVSFLSFAYGTNIVIHALMGKVPVVGFSSLASLISFLLGIVILMLGIIGEYLVRIFAELSRRPEAVVQEVY